MKKFLLIPVLFFSAIFAFARNFEFNLEPTAGLRYGHIGEYVILIDSPYDKDILSYLEWDIQSDILCGLKADLTWKYFSIETSIKSSIPKTSGQMQDSDWLNIQYSGFPSDYTVKTNYSEHNNSIDFHFYFDATTSALIPISSTFTIAPYISFSYDDIKFLGYDGFYSYGNPKYYIGYDENGNLQTILFKYNENGNCYGGKIKGSVINYEKETWNIWAGANITAGFENGINLTLGGAIGLYTLSYGIDNHLSRTTDFLDIMEDFASSYKGFVTVLYPISEKNILSVSANIESQSLIIGPDYQKASSQKYFYNSDKSTVVMGGSDSFIFELSVGYCFSF